MNFIPRCLVGRSELQNQTRIMIEVDSIDEFYMKAIANGAKSVKEKMDFDTFYLAYVEDPTGQCIGLIPNK